jgi:hypothetical protein
MIWHGKCTTRQPGTGQHNVWARGTRDSVLESKRAGEHAMDAKTDRRWLSHNSRPPMPAFEMVASAALKPEFAKDQGQGLAPARRSMSGGDGPFTQARAITRFPETRTPPTPQ